MPKMVRVLWVRTPDLDDDLDAECRVMDPDLIVVAVHPDLMSDEACDVVSSMCTRIAAARRWERRPRLQLIEGGAR
jgi:hypothetical protein